MMSYLCVNRESDYSEENTGDKEDLRSTILEPFQFEPEQNKTYGNESHEKETTEAVGRKYSSKQAFLEISQGSTCVGVSL